MRSKQVIASMGEIYDAVYKAHTNYSDSFLLAEILALKLEIQRRKTGESIGRFFEENKMLKRSVAFYVEEGVKL